MQYADFATYGIACGIVCSHITGIPNNCASVQRALLAPEILNESFLKCRYFTALFDYVYCVGSYVTLVILFLLFYFFMYHVICFYCILFVLCLAVLVTIWSFCF